jgi:hypothetical protein
VRRGVLVATLAPRGVASRSSATMRATSRWTVLSGDLDICEASRSPKVT